MTVRNCCRNLSYTDVISFFKTRKCQKVNNKKKEKRWSSFFLKNLRNFNEIFRKDVTYGNIKIHKKSGLHLLSRRYIFGKATRGRASNWPTSSLLRVNEISTFKLSQKCLADFSRRHDLWKLMQQKFVNSFANCCWEFSWEIIPRKKKRDIPVMDDNAVYEKHWCWWSVDNWYLVLKYDKSGQFCNQRVTLAFQRWKLHEGVD